MSNDMPSTKKSAANRYDQELAESKETATEPQGTIVEFVTALVAMGTSTSVIVDVPEWEMDILREIHGAESVIAHKHREVMYPHSAAEAMQYLKNKYNTRDHEDIIKAIYPRLRDFAKSTGLPYETGDEARNRTQASSVIYHDQPAASSKGAATKQRVAGSGTSGGAAA